MEVRQLCLAELVRVGGRTGHSNGGRNIEMRGVGCAVAGRRCGVRPCAGVVGGERGG